MYDCYVGGEKQKKNSYKSCRGEFCSKFPNTTCPSGDKIFNLMMKVQTHGILIDRKPLKGNHVSAEEKLDIGHRLENSP
jgi:hypothetical protein